MFLFIEPKATIIKVEEPVGEHLHPQLQDQVSELVQMVENVELQTIAERTVEVAVDQAFV